MLLDTYLALFLLFFNVFVALLVSQHDFMRYMNIFLFFLFNYIQNIENKLSSTQSQYYIQYYSQNNIFVYIIQQSKNKQNITHLYKQTQIKNENKKQHNCIHTQQIIKYHIDKSSSKSPKSSKQSYIKQYTQQQQTNIDKKNKDTRAEISSAIMQQMPEKDYQYLYKLMRKNSKGNKKNMGNQQQSVQNVIGQNYGQSEKQYGKQQAFDDSADQKQTQQQIKNKDEYILDLTKFQGYHHQKTFNHQNKTKISKNKTNMNHQRTKSQADMFIGDSPQLDNMNKTKMLLSYRGPQKNTHDNTIIFRQNNNGNNRKRLSYNNNEFCKTDTIIFEDSLIKSIDHYLLGLNNSSKKGDQQTNQQKSFMKNGQYSRKIKKCSKKLQLQSPERDRKDNNRYLAERDSINSNTSQQLRRRTLSKVKMQSQLLIKFQQKDAQAKSLKQANQRLIAQNTKLAKKQKALKTKMFRMLDHIRQLTQDLEKQRSQRKKMQRFFNDFQKKAALFKPKNKKQNTKIELIEEYLLSDNTEESQETITNEYNENGRYKEEEDNCPVLDLLNSMKSTKLISENVQPNSHRNYSRHQKYTTNQRYSNLDFNDKFSVGFEDL